MVQASLKLCKFETAGIDVVQLQSMSASLAPSVAVSARIYSGNHHRRMRMHTILLCAPVLLGNASLVALCTTEPLP